MGRSPDPNADKLAAYLELGPPDVDMALVVEAWRAKMSVEEFRDAMRASGSTKSQAGEREAKRS